MTKQALVAFVVALALVAAFGLGHASSPQPADAATGNAAIVAQLKKLNTTESNTNVGIHLIYTRLGSIDNSIGPTSFSTGTVRGFLRAICHATPGAIC